MIYLCLIVNDENENDKRQSKQIESTSKSSFIIQIVMTLILVILRID